MLGMIIIQLLGQLFLRGGLNDLWSMFFTLQIVCFLKFYTIPVPSNTEIYRDQFAKLVEFDIFNPVTAAQYVDPNFNSMDYLRGKEVMVVSKA